MLARTDYMIHSLDDNLKMIEYNLHSPAGFAKNTVPWYQFLMTSVLKCKGNFGHFEANKISKRFALVIVHAMEEYEKMYKTTNTKALFIVFDGNPKLINIRPIMIDIFKQGRIAIKRTFSEMAKLIKVDDENRLFVDGSEISVVFNGTTGNAESYFRDDNWHSVIRPIEFSRAVKSPDMGQVLANFKKVQQYFTQTQNFLEEFNDFDSCLEMRKAMIGTFDLNDRNLALEVLQEPENFVLKSAFGEGGGHCLFDDDLKEKVRSWLNEWDQSRQERAQFVVMQKIRPPTHENWSVAGGGKMRQGQFVAEVGFFGTLLAVDGRVLSNDYIGTYVRNKLDSENEIGCGNVSSLIIED